MQRHMQNQGDHRAVERPGAGSSGIHAADRPLQKGLLLSSGAEEAASAQPVLEQRQHTSPKVNEAKDGTEMIREEKKD